MVEKIIKNFHSKEGTLNMTFYIYIVKFFNFRTENRTYNMKTETVS